MGFNPAISRIKIIKIEEEGIDYPSVCLHCEDPPCVKICPVDALWREDGKVVFSRDVCIGCKMCVTICPFGAIALENGKIIKCDLCNGDPFCVKHCPTGAIRYEESALARALKGLEYAKNIKDIKEGR